MNINSFNLANIFSDNVILQRNKQIKVWGESEENNSITVSINNIEVTVEAENGKWMAMLPPMEANEGCEMRVRSNNPTSHEIVIKNVAIGEVWIAGGQSNMEFALKYEAECKESISLSNNPNIRFYDCAKISYEGQESDKDLSEFGFWRPCDSENTPYYSAVGFYFARKIYNAQKVPIGIIGCNWGGTTASTWLDEKYLEDDEELKVYLNEYKDAIKDLNLEEYEMKVKQSKIAKNSPEAKVLSNDMMMGISSSEKLLEMISKLDPLVMMPLVGPKHQSRPAGLYHNMVEKIAGYSVRGVVWYQGESDENKATIYSKLFSALINCWREAWQEELPFLFVQLAPFRSWLWCTGKSFPTLREQQEIVSKTVPNTYMVSIMDMGMEFDIHPKKKRHVGERLALLARNKVYGEDIISEAPEVDYVEFKERIIKISFKNVGDKFILKDKKINGIQIFADEKELFEFKSQVKKNNIYIESEQFNDNNKIEVKFAWMDYVEVNLYSSAGLPVKPFKIVI